MNIQSKLPMSDYEFQKINIRNKTFALETMLREMPQAELKLIHHFSPGVYARELHIPADCTLTGEIHKYPQLNILSKGKISVLLEDGIKEIEAPFAVVSPAGTKRIAYAHTDCVWTTILHTNETDIKLIEKHFLAKTEEEWLEFNKSNQLEFENV
jgi:hypothetical protein